MPLPKGGGGGIKTLDLLVEPALGTLSVPASSVGRIFFSCDGLVLTPLRCRMADKIEVTGLE